MTKVGERVIAVCGKNEVTGAVEIFGRGTYEGDFVPVEAAGEMAAILRDHGVPNPRIRLDDGNVVYGCECWWGTEERVKNSLAGMKLLPVSIVEKRLEVDGGMFDSVKGESD